MSKEQQIRAYLEEHVDPFLKPLLMDIMKQQPANVHTYIASWINGRGKEINDQLQNNQRDLSKSVHYDNVKKSVIEQKEEAPAHNDAQEAQQEQEDRRETLAEEPKQELKKSHAEEPRESHAEEPKAEHNEEPKHEEHAEEHKEELKKSHAEPPAEHNDEPAPERNEEPKHEEHVEANAEPCLLYTSPSPRDS